MESKDKDRRGTSSHPGLDFARSELGQFREHHHRHYMDEAVQREIEKQEIREEIIRSEVAIRRRILLEAEVRRERMMERELSMHRHIQLGSSSVMGFESLNEDRESGGFEITPFHREAAPAAPVLETGREKQKIILLAKPEKSAVGSKRKASSPPPPPEVDAIEIPKDGISSKNVKKTSWKCAICEITTTCEQGLQDHLTGKKHKSKESRLASHKTTGENYTIGLLPKKPIKPGPIVETNDLKENETWKEKQSEKVKKNDDLWCDVRVTSEKNMEIHKKGKKHVIRVLGMSKNETNMVKAVNHGEIIEDGKSVTSENIDDEQRLEDDKAVDETEAGDGVAKVEDESINDFDEEIVVS